MINSWNSLIGPAKLAILMGLLVAAICIWGSLYGPRAVELGPIDELKAMNADRSGDDQPGAEIEPMPITPEPGVTRVVHVTWDTIFEICDLEYRLAEVTRGYCFLLPVGSEGHDENE